MSREFLDLLNRLQGSRHHGHLVGESCGGFGAPPRHRQDAGCEREGEAPRPDLEPPPTAWPGSIRAWRHLRAARACGAHRNEQRSTCHQAAAAKDERRSHAALTLTPSLPSSFLFTICILATASARLCAPDGSHSHTKPARAAPARPGNKTSAYSLCNNASTGAQLRAIASLLTLPGALAERVMFGRLLHAAERAVVVPLFDAFNVFYLALAARQARCGEHAQRCDSEGKALHDIEYVRFVATSQATSSSN